MKSIYFYITAILVITLMSSCNKDKDLSKDNPQGNDFKSKDEALKNVTQSLPELLNENQKKLFAISDNEIKSLKAGPEASIRYVDFNQIMNSRDTSMMKLIPADEQATLIALSSNNNPKLGVTLRKDKSKWLIESVGERDYVKLFQSQSIINNSRIIEIPGMELTFVQTGNDSSGFSYKPVKNYSAAGFTADSVYNDSTVLKMLKVYGELLRKQFGDKLNKGEIDR